MSLQIVRCSVDCAGRGKVAFFVGLSENIGPISETAAVVFDRIVTNVGSAYDAKTGYFTAPVNGTYQFTVIVSAQGRQKVSAPVLIGRRKFLPPRKFAR